MDDGGPNFDTCVLVEDAINGASGSFPSAASYNLIFLTAAIISLVSIILVIIIKDRMLLESGVAGIRINHR